ncbi:phosphoribosylanthranilate isomerase [Methanolobus halotolerans]|uniref:N-(5'-phosphoribosyl)anthranilate isomerase n=1 Tax=Methanolobus halotolerans TaxID=2052935 RepID=A0A4E0PZK8_9EURY|nr:phosphoribosylanthranilate isomerase [Methanolobus halotolerans]TGC11073.1 N-(5'-phosphoribosyl)anthranilate isomerase [Methanolobus halotolerans]
MKHLPKVKICGMKCAEDIKMAVNCGADAVGFITEVPVDSSRKIDVRTAAGLVNKVPLFVDSVLVIMPSDGCEALRLIEKAEPDVVQLHNDIDVEDMGLIRDNTSKSIIKTFTIPLGTSVIAKEMISQMDKLVENDLVDGILLDTGKAGMSGGTGLTHNWSLSRDIIESMDMPVILAGGLNPENVRSAVEKVRPFGVDTASGVETGGKKDPAKVCRFVREARCING